MPDYRVCFTNRPDIYYFVSGANARKAVRRATGIHRAMRHNKLRRIRLRVARIERRVRGELRPIKWRP
jgi:hypothetical protein